jgi:cytochrome d ubiquinol oxidase subunit II
MIAGAVASGRVPADGYGDVWTSWTGPTSWLGGTLAVLTCTFLAGTFLAADFARAGHDDMAATMGRRALVAGAITGAAALVAAVVLEFHAESLASGLHGRGAALIAVSGVAGLFSLWRLRAGQWARARVGAVIAVGAIVIGWGVGQYPDLLVDEMTIADAAGDRSTLIGLVIVFGLAAVTAVPALLWLFWLVNRTEWASDAAPAVEPSSAGEARPPA